MNELRILNNRIFSYIFDVDDLIPYKLRVNGYESFDKKMLESQDSDENRFRTPSNLKLPNEGPCYQYDSYDLSIEELKSKIVSKLDSELNVNFSIRDFWFLYQTNDEWVVNKEHFHMTADWIASIYLDVKEGDSIEFFDENGNSEKYYPKFGEVLFFPGFVLHKPSPNVGKKRLSLNIELYIEKTEKEIETITERLNICKECEKFNIESNKCSECNCIVPMIITIMEKNCPQNKWRINE